jgi:hypothetical protein
LKGKRKETTLGHRDRPIHVVEEKFITHFGQRDILAVLKKPVVIGDSSRGSYKRYGQLQGLFSSNFAILTGGRG